VTVPFDPALVVLNRFDRINQARTAHERTLFPGGPFGSVQPYVDMTVFINQLVDTTLLRMEHIWSGAADEPASPDVIAVSNTHYWDVGGLWPEGTSFRARFNYQGGSVTGLDQDLVAGNESGMLMVYRADPMQLWIIDIEELRPGQYAFAKSTISIGVTELEAAAPLELFPVPATDQITLILPVSETVDDLQFEVYAADGRSVLTTHRSRRGDGRYTIDVRALAPGHYVVVQRADGQVQRSARAIISR
jgi:hypothetical protein